MMSVPSPKRTQLQAMTSPGARQSEKMSGFVPLASSTEFRESRNIASNDLPTTQYRNQQTAQDTDQKCSLPQSWCCAGRNHHVRKRPREITCQVRTIRCAHVVLDGAQKHDRHCCAADPKAHWHGEAAPARRDPGFDRKHQHYRRNEREAPPENQSPWNRRGKTQIRTKRQDDPALQAGSCR